MARKQALPDPSWASDPQYLAFESDITQHPEDDTPRLVLADWLEEHSDEHGAARAEFIRLQIELAHLSSEDPRYPELSLRQNELLQQHEQAWLGNLASVVTEVVWVRGFPQKLRLGIRQFMEHADELFRQAPILHLQLLRISQTKLPIDEIARCPYFAKLRGLSLPGSAIGDEKLAVFFRRANLPQLESLDLSGAVVGPQTLRTLADADLPNLRTLDLTANSLRLVLRELCSERVRFQLHQLALTNCDLALEDTEALFSWSALQSVRTLSLRNNHLGTQGGTQLAQCTYFASLQSLDLSSCEIGARGAQALASAGAFPSLVDLDLGDNHIRPTGFQALLNCSFLERFRALKLHQNILGDTSVVRLAAWPALSRIRLLDLQGNQLTQGGIRALCNSPYLGPLTSLSLSDNPLGDEGLFLLARCPRLSSLKILRVSVVHGMSDQGAEAILSSPYLSNLQHLMIAGNPLSPELAKRLNKRFPHSTYRWR